MANLTPKDFEAFAQEESLFQFENKPIFQGVLSSWAKCFQDVEDVIYDLYQVNIYTAVGVQLDHLYGELFGVPRLSRNDSEYRAAILAKITTLNSDGTIENLQGNLEALTLSENVVIFEHFPADIHAYLGGTFSGHTYQEAGDLSLAGVSTRLIVDDNFTCFIPSLFLETTADLQVYQGGVPADLQANVTASPADLQINLGSIAQDTIQRAILPELNDQLDNVEYNELSLLLFSTDQVPDPSELIIGSGGNSIETFTGTLSGELTASGSLNENLDGISMSGMGGTYANIGGTISETLDSVTSVASGSLTVIVTGSISEDLDDVTLTGGADLEIFGTLSENLTDITSVASGELEVIGTSTVSSDDVTSSISGELSTTSGTANNTTENFTLSASGLVPTGFSFTDMVPEDDQFAVQGPIRQSTGTYSLSDVGNTEFTLQLVQQPQEYVVNALVQIRNLENLTGSSRKATISLGFNSGSDTVRILAEDLVCDQLYSKVVTHAKTDNNDYDVCGAKFTVDVEDTYTTYVVSGTISLTTDDSNEQISALLTVVPNYDSGGVVEVGDIDFSMTPSSGYNIYNLVPTRFGLASDTVTTTSIDALDVGQNSTAIEFTSVHSKRQNRVVNVVAAIEVQPDVFENGYVNGVLELRRANVSATRTRAYIKDIKIISPDWEDIQIRASNLSDLNGSQTINFRINTSNPNRTTAAQTSYIYFKIETPARSGSETSQEGVWIYSEGSGIPGHGITYTHYNAHVRNELEVGNVNSTGSEGSIGDIVGEFDYNLLASDIVSPFSLVIGPHIALSTAEASVTASSFTLGSGGLPQFQETFNIPALDANNDSVGYRYTTNTNIQTITFTAQYTVTRQSGSTDLNVDFRVAAASLFGEGVFKTQAGLVNGGHTAETRDGTMTVTRQSDSSFITLNFANAGGPDLRRYTNGTTDESDYSSAAESGFVFAGGDSSEVYDITVTLDLEESVST